MRHLLMKERKLLECLLNQVSGISYNLDSLQVEEMDDGGMGSLYLNSELKKKNERKFGRCVAEIQFTDSDNIPILVSLNIDNFGDLFEIDIWKVDFSPVKKYPEC